MKGKILTQDLIDDFTITTRNFAFNAPIMYRALAYARQLISPQEFVLGVDLSHWNTLVDFELLYAAGYRFVILKATEGVDYVDLSFSPRWPQALEAGMIVGTYHFFRSNYDGVAQADFHLRIIEPLLNATSGRVIPPCNDVETIDGVEVVVRKPRVLSWNARVHDVLKVMPLCYSSPYMWSTLMGNSYMDTMGFVAHWTSAQFPMWPIGWPGEFGKFWQYGVYPKYSWALPAPTGVAGECDLIRFFGNMSDLRELIGETDYTLEEKVDILWDEYLDKLAAIEKSFEE